MGVGGYLSAQAERDHYRYLKRTTRERVQRSCAGEMEREVNAILSPLGVDDSLSRRVAGALLSVEATLPCPAPHPSIFRKCLNVIARRPKFSGLGGGADEERTSLLRGAIQESANGEEDDEKGLTAFLLKFGEGLEETTDARLFISAVTIGVACECRAALFSSPRLIPCFLRLPRWFGAFDALLLHRVGPYRTHMVDRHHFDRPPRVRRRQNVLHRSRSWSVTTPERLLILC